MHEMTLLFLAGLAASTGLRFWLAQRQIAHVRAHREQVPAEFRDRIDAAQHRKAADYTTARTRFARLTLIFDAALLLVWTLGGGLELLDRSLAGLQWGPIATGVAFLVAYALINTLIELPADVYRTFGIESRFGFNRSTPGLFISDQLKGLALGAVLGIPLVAVVLWLLDSAGTFWWFYTWLVWMGFNLLLLWAYPTLIAPLFNRFTPLDDQALRQRIENLLQRCGFTSQGVFVADGSRRSSHGNAYFTGFGRNKRIVFFDTLLEALTPEQIEAVLAHELGHFKRKHVLKNILLMALLSLAGLALLGWLMTNDWFYAALGLSRASDHGALVLFMILGSVFGVLLQPLMAQLSRRFEFEADAFAAAQCPADDLVEALVRLYRDNASTLTPDPLHSAFHDSHPPASIRIAQLRAAGRAGTAVGYSPGT